MKLERKTQMSKDEKFWDALSNKYDKQVEKVFCNAYKKTISYTKKYVKETDIVLDIGCGTGITTIELTNYVKEIHALDLSGNMLKIAKEKAISKGINNISFHQKSIFNQEFQNQNYDVIIAFNVLCYIQEDVNFIYRIYDLLKDGGLFISVTDCLGEKESIMISLQKLLGRFGIIPKINIYTTTELEKKIIDCKFTIEQSENLHTIPPNYFIVGQKSQLDRKVM